jgi:hypothetical protein
MTAMTRSEFIKKLNSAKPGERIVYHTGLLMANRKVASDSRKNIEEAAEEAMKSYRRGQCHLFQERVQVGICNYLAVKR